MNIYVSPTLMGQVKKCPRCVYDPLAFKLKAPRGIMASLPNGMDETIKKYFDSFRGSLPPELESLKPWVLHPDQKMINEMREWNGLKAVHVVETEINGRPVRHTLTMQGGLDDLLLHPKTGEIAIPDIKTKANEPPLEYAALYYQETMEAYAWLLTKLGHQVSPSAYLCYWYPLTAQPMGKYQFGTKLLPMTLDINNTTKLLDQIGMMLPCSHAEVMKKRPDPSPQCELCTFVQERMNLDAEQKEQEEVLHG